MFASHHPREGQKDVKWLVVLHRNIPVVRYSLVKILYIKECVICIKRLLLFWFSGVFSCVCARVSVCVNSLQKVDVKCSTKITAIMSCPTYQNFPSTCCLFFNLRRVLSASASISVHVVQQIWSAGGVVENKTKPQPPSHQRKSFYQCCQVPGLSFHLKYFFPIALRQLRNNQL